MVNNPNNWHWVDKNCMQWAKEYFSEHVAGLSAADDSVSVAVSEVSSVEGDVEVCQRKGKVISLFDLRLVADLAGEYKGAPLKGLVTVPELAYDTEEDDIQFDVSIYDNVAGADELRMVAKKQLVPKIRAALLVFGRDLIAAHALDIQLEGDKVNSVFTKENQAGTEKAGTEKAVAGKSAAGIAAQKPAVAAQKPTAAKAAAQSGSVPRYNTSTLHLEPVFNTTAEQLYMTLLDAQRVTAWTRSAPQMEAFPPAENSEFRFFGGSVRGRFTRLVPNERVTQQWRLEDWKDGHYAELDIQLKQGAGETTMVVKWLGIPVGEEDRVRGNFEDYYVRSIKIVFGFGAVL